MTNVDRIVLTPEPNITHAYNNVSVTVKEVDPDLKLVPHTLPGDAPHRGHPHTLTSFLHHKGAAEKTPAKGERIYWLVGFHFENKPQDKSPSFKVELPEVPGRPETNFYYIEQENGDVIFLGRTVQGGGPVTVPLTLDDPSVGMT